MRKLFRLTPVVNTDLVAAGNLSVAVIAGACAWLVYRASLGSIVAITAFVFSLLTAFLFHRWTFWISVVLASLVIAAATAAFFAGIGLRVNAAFGGWLGGGLGFALGGYGAWSAYRDFVREE